MSRVDELADVESQGLAVRHVLGGDGTGVAECLSAGRGRSRGVAGEILEINEYRRAIGVNEAGNGRIEAIGEVCHLHALAGDQLTMTIAHLLCLRYRRIRKCSVGKLQGLR